SGIFGTVAKEPLSRRNRGTKHEPDAGRRKGRCRLEASCAPGDLRHARGAFRTLSAGKQAQCLAGTSRAEAAELEPAQGLSGRRMVIPEVIIWEIVTCHRNSNGSL